MTRAMNKAIVYISWAPECSRSDGIAAKLGGKSFMIYSPLWGSRYSTVVFKYFSQTIKTLLVLLRERPKCVFVMTPPVIACLVVWLYAKLTRTFYIIDAHSAAFLQSRWQCILFLHRFFSRRARTTIVTSQYLRNIVASWGATSTIVSDVPIDFGGFEHKNLPTGRNMVFISSFTPDEPLSVFFEAAARLPNIQFYVTGDYHSADHAIIASKPPNVIFTGFLPKAEYAALLTAADAVICLTILDHTMQRGAYEAVYLGKPVITSNTELLRMAFPKGTVHVNSTVEDIERGILEMNADLEKYCCEVQQLRVEKLATWRTTEKQLRDFSLIQV
jgi:glycosyltransferase involved in cell wall biosynthesis